MPWQESVLPECTFSSVVVYLRANWNSYTFGPHWSHSRVEIHHCTLGHAGIRTHRDTLYTAGCWCLQTQSMRYAASHAINKQAISPMRGQINTHETLFQFTDMSTMWNSNILGEEVEWVVAAFIHGWMNSKHPIILSAHSSWCWISEGPVRWWSPGLN